MASNEDSDLFSASDLGPARGEESSTPAASPSEPSSEAAAPAKKAAKRAPRKATKKAAAPQSAAVPGDDPVPAATEAGAEAGTEAGSESGTAAGTEQGDAAPAKKAAKRAPRKATKKAAPPAESPSESVSSPASVEAVAPKKRSRKATAPAGAADEGQVSVGDQSAAAAFAPLFQPPVQTPRRRRAASAPAGPATDADSPPVAASGSGSASDSEQGSHAGHRSDPGSTEQDDSRATGDDSSGSGGRTRRRRGGKGRKGRTGADGDQDHGKNTDGKNTDGKNTGAKNSDNKNRDNKNSDKDAADDDRSDDQRGGSDHDTDDSGEGGSRRRTRRRRRSGGSGDNDDRPGTVTNVREPRKASDEVTSIKGSTRLEAKKQRRREGREAGRRRTIITEAEFLARRESVERTMLVRYLDGRTQIVVLEDGVLVEHYISGEVNASMAGNVYLGRIQNVLPSMEAAFVDVGRGRNAVLYAGEVNWDAAGMDGKSRRIEHALKSGGTVLAQVTKDPIGHKGARLTSQISLPGRYLVYVPNSSMTGISRKLPDPERARLKKLLREIVPEHAGVIVRTAAEGASEAELRADVERLTAAWESIEAKAKTANAPVLIHGEPDLTVRVIRDVFNEDFRSLEVSGQPAWDAVSDYVNTVAPDLADRLNRWTGEQDIFAHYRVDEQLSKAMDRKVWLPSGGTLVIDRTEAMTVIDVNTGKFVGSGGNLEQTVTKNNIEAAEEIVRQMRLRDIGGIIVVDFIDMVLESNRDLVMRRLVECLGRDRTKHQVAEVTSLGLVQMTRKRVGAGLIEVFSENCEHCNGRGIIVHTDPVDPPAPGADDDRGSGSHGSRGRRGRSGGDTSSNGQQQGSGRKAGGSSTQQAGPEPKPVSTGPTAAQIAAAAHAAAARSGEPGVGVVDQGEHLAEPMAAPEPVAEAPAPRARRKRGRVVAPAGPPHAVESGATAGHDGVADTTNAAAQ